MSTSETGGETAPLTTNRRGAVLVATLDRGKANAISFEVVDALNAALDEVEGDAELGALVLCGRPGMLSGGFDLAVMGEGGRATFELVTAGGAFAHRMYSGPTPVVVAASGHAVAMGALLLLGAHHRVGARGPYKIGLIETAIGMVLPDWSIALSAERLSKRHFQQATIEARIYDPDGAVDAGFLDKVVEPEDLLDTAVAEAESLAGLNRGAYAAICAKIRGPGSTRIADLLEADRKMIAGLGDEPGPPPRPSEER